MTSPLASTGFISTQCFSVAIMHDLNMGEVILDCSIWFLSDSFLNNHVQKQRHWTTALVWVHPFTSFTEMASLVYGKWVIQWSTWATKLLKRYQVLTGNPWTWTWSRCYIREHSRVHRSYSAHKMLPHFTLGRHWNYFEIQPASEHTA